MFKNSKAFSGFSVDNIGKAKEFYGQILGVEIGEEHGMIFLQLATDAKVLVYPKDDHKPATYTMLNFPVDDIEKAVDQLTVKGIEFERYEGMRQDKKGIMREWGPPIAWFKDPAGNIIAVLEDK